MQTIAVFVNEVAAARHMLQPLLAPGGEGPTRWLLVACPPRLTRHIGRWVTHGARQQWRHRWAADLFGALEPELRAQTGGEVETLIANRPLVDVAADLLALQPPMRLLDARRLRAGRPDEPITAAQPLQEVNRWVATVVAAAGLSLMLTLVD